MKYHCRVSLLLQDEGNIFYRHPKRDILKISYSMMIWLFTFCDIIFIFKYSIIKSEVYSEKDGIVAFDFFVLFAIVELSLARLKQIA